MEVSFDGLKERLDMLDWPSLYMFKFIVPTLKADEIGIIFNFDNITSKESKSGKYVSITSHMYLSSPEEVIDIYLKASKVEGVIAL
ncbi:MAG TPA: DUF493 family protein [Cytophagaceae bacterium]|jgi:hypothetical protein